jgi:hypothetical protein
MPDRNRLRVSFFGKLVSVWTNATMQRSVTSNEGTGLRIKRPQVLTGRPPTKVVHNDLCHGRGRLCRPVDRSCVHWNGRNTRHANKADSQDPNRGQNDAHCVSSIVMQKYNGAADKMNV